MRIPEPKRKPNGKWIVQVQIDGKRTAKIFESYDDAVYWASGIKTRNVSSERKKSQTLREAIDHYIEKRESVLSQLTLRAYRIIQRNRFQSIMDVKLESISPREWQAIVNAEAKSCSAKTLKNAYGLVRSAVFDATGTEPPACRMPQIVRNDSNFLQPEQIPVFVKAVYPTRYAVPLLMALSSMRISEIAALDWEDIPKDPEFIPVRGAEVLTPENKWVRQQTNKNASSARNVPIIIPELRDAIRRDRKKSGRVLDITQNSLRCALKKICRDNDLPDITVHGLRHSFASLAYHLQIPERITMEIGGWSDNATMTKIYTHIAQSDIKRYATAMSDFYRK